jgi:MFS family permease
MTALSSSHRSLITSILSCGTFFGAVIAGDLADWIGRKWTVILGCVIYLIGCIIQIVTSPTNALGPLVAGRLIAGFGVGFESAIVILYMSEIVSTPPPPPLPPQLSTVIAKTNQDNRDANHCFQCPRKFRGAIVAGYQFCITIGLLLASCIDYAARNMPNTGQYRVPIGIQFPWALILGGGLLLLPDSPRFYVKRGQLQKAVESLSRVRGQPRDSDYVQNELAEIVANEEYERALIPNTTWFGSWANCFKGGLWASKSNLRRTILGTSLQMMQQWTGINFIMYFSTPFLQSTGAIKNSFVISIIFSLVNVCSTPVSFWAVERLGRRPILIYGAFGMLICQFIVAAIGVTVGFDSSHTDAAGNTVANNIPAVNAQIAFICFYIFFFAATWGPAAWIVIGEIFPLPIRSRGVGLSTASNWLWNTIIAVITPYMVDTDKGNLKSAVFFIWGSLCTCAFVYAYFLVPETKGLSLEQVDKMMEETNPRQSAKWRPTTTFAADAATNSKLADANIVGDVEHRGSSL